MWTTVLYGMALPFLSVIASGILNALVICVASVTFVRETYQVTSLDRLLAVSGWCSTRRAGRTRHPGVGFHAVWLGGLVIAARAETQSHNGTDISYTVYTFTRGSLCALLDCVNGDPKFVKCLYVYAPAPYRTHTSMNLVVPKAKPQAWQRGVVKSIADQWQKTGRATALVCGSPGMGKSELGVFVAQELKARDSLVEPFVIKNMSLTASGLLLEDVVKDFIPSQPAIILLNEFDTTIDHSLRTARGDREGMCLADSKQSLLDFLDRLAETKDLIVIATSNVLLADLSDGKYEPFTRKGRFDIRRQVQDAK